MFSTLSRRPSQLAVVALLTVMRLSAVGSTDARITSHRQAGDQKITNAARSVVFGWLRANDTPKPINATLTLTNLNNGEEIRTSNSQYGNFIFQSVRPGSYELTAVAAGYKKTTVKTVYVQTGYEAVVELTLLKDVSGHVITGEGVVLANGSQLAERSEGQTRTGQNGYSIVHGVALDPNRAVVGRARLTLTNTDSHARQNALTDDYGRFQFKFVSRGRYDLTIASPGFYEFKVEHVSVAESENNRIIAILQVDERIKGDEPVSAESEVLTVSPSEPKPSKPLPPVAETGATRLMNAVVYDDRKAIRDILATGADVDSSTSYGMTALMKITEKTSANSIRELLMAGADVNHKDKDGRTALLIAARSGNAALLQALLDAGAHRLISDKDGNTALIYAVLGKRIDNVRTLIAARADLSTRNNQGLSALKYAINNKSEDIVKLLRASGAAE